MLTNEVNGKYYVGKTSKPSLDRYLQNVVSLALKGRDNRPLLHRAIRKHGSDAFIIEPLVECETNDQACNYERLWIVTLDSRNRDIGYNLSEGGEGSPGCKHSEETKAKWSAQRKGQLAWNKGILHTRNARHKMSVAQQGAGNGFFGKTHSDETRKKIADSNRQRVWDDAARKRMSEAKKGFKFTKESIAKMKTAAKAAWMKRRTYIDIG